MKEDKTVENIKERLKNALEQLGTYRPHLFLQIEITARDYLIYQRINDAALKAEVMVETDRGPIINPIFASSELASRRLTDDLAKLLMNLKDSTSKTAKKEDKKKVSKMEEVKEAILKNLDK